MVIKIYHTLIVKISKVTIFEILHTKSHLIQQLSIKDNHKVLGNFQTYTYTCIIILLSEFHVNCLKPWIDDHQSCPVCRKQIGKETYLSI